MTWDRDVMNASPTRGAQLLARMTALGITKLEFASRASIDRGTLDRALSDDPKMTDRTWAKIEHALADAEDEVGMVGGDHFVTTTIEYRGAKITVHGTPEDAAETARRILDAN